jgi:hypothetical protein
LQPTERAYQPRRQSSGEILILGHAGLFGYNNNMSGAVPSSSSASHPRRFRWRRLLQFRLRTILILTTIIAGSLGWWTRADRQRAAVEKLGGRRMVAYDLRSQTLARYCPSWLLDRIGIDLVAVPTDFILQACEPKPPLKPLEELRHLELVQDWGCRLTDADVFHLRHVGTLKKFDVPNAPISDTGFEYLKHASHLEWINLRGTGISDKSMTIIRHLNALQVLALNRTKITNAGLSDLAGLTHLQELHLRKTVIDDAGLVHIARVNSLRKLDLSETQVTDAGLKHFESLTSLQYLDLRYTHVTDEGVERLRQCLPNCKIVH